LCLGRFSVELSRYHYYSVGQKYVPAVSKYPNDYIVDLTTITNNNNKHLRTMGKKSKRKSDDKPPSRCYHGCTKQEFNNSGAHYKVIEDWIRLELIDDENQSKECNKFFEKNLRVMANPTFGRFLVAHIADDYLKDKNDVYLCSRLFLLVCIRHFSITTQMKKVNKYSRDIRTRRGVINCIAREIPCDCMEAKRIEAKSMDKVAMCYYCKEEFLKEKMLQCKGCNCVQYCSEECSIKAWPEHKKCCNQLLNYLENVYEEDEEE